MNPNMFLSQSSKSYKQFVLIMWLNYIADLEYLMLSFNLSSNMSDNLLSIKLDQLFTINASNVNLFVLTFLTLKSKQKDKNTHRVKLSHY